MESIVFCLELYFLMYVGIEAWLPLKSIFHLKIYVYIHNELKEQLIILGGEEIKFFIIG